MFTRLLKRRNHSILLLGPRGTGKSTWIRQHFPQTKTYDLLHTSEALRLSQDPSQLRRELMSLKEGSWVVIDEVQKVPALLNEVHGLIENKKIKFVLSGSNARKLKSKDVNLLAGRARLTHLFPLVSSEVNFHIDIANALRFGMLPSVFSDEDAPSYLKTYAETYLQEEIRNEALARDIGAFSRFLDVAARQNGQQTNVTQISRDAQVARQTVQGYFDILVDTLIGFWFWPWKFKRSTKQVTHPKFYFFDTGIVRALSGRLSYPLLSEEEGFYLETWILHELRSYLSYSQLDFPIYFWRNHEGAEVDIFFEDTQGFTAVEIKSARRWEKKFNRGLNRLKKEIGAKRITCYGVYLGEHVQVFDDIEIFPLLVFLQKLWSGDLIT